jgi:hypothetical protein
LCLMIMPGRICVAGIAIKEKLLALLLKWGVKPGFLLRYTGRRRVCGFH